MTNTVTSRVTTVVARGELCRIASGESGPWLQVYYQHLLDHSWISRPTVPLTTEAIDILAEHGIDFDSTYHIIYLSDPDEMRVCLASAGDEFIAFMPNMAFVLDKSLVSECLEQSSLNLKETTLTRQEAWDLYQPSTGVTGDT